MKITNELLIKSHIPAEKPAVPVVEPAVKHTCGTCSMHKPPAITPSDMVHCTVTQSLNHKDTERHCWTPMGPSKPLPAWMVGEPAVKVEPWVKPSTVDNMAILQLQRRVEKLEKEAKG